MAITVNIYYTGNRGAARKFAEEMTVSGVVDAIRAEAGEPAVCLFLPHGGPGDCAADRQLARSAGFGHPPRLPHDGADRRLREQYDLHMRVERYLSDETPTTSQDEAFIRR